MNHLTGLRDDERGLTLIEVLLVLGITAAILVPVMAWSVMALGRSANSDIDADTTAFIQLSRFLDADVSASYGGGDTPASTLDCAPAPGSAIAAGTLALRLVSTRTAPVVTTYASVDTGEVDGAGRQVTQLVRRTCTPGAAAGDETVVAERLVGDVAVPPVVVSCEDRTSRGADDCGQVSMQVQGVYGDPVTVRAARRVDPDPDPSLGRRPIAIMECEPDCPATVYREDSIRFDGTLSSDPDPGGGITYYRWDFGDGTSPVEGNPAQAGVVTHAYTQLGEFRVVLTVGNDKGNTATAEAVVTVRNAAPIAVATPNPVNSTRREAVHFDASQSVDPDQGGGAGPTYEWNFGDGSTATGVTPSPHQYLTIGSYTATLTVTDRDGSATTISIPVKVTNRPPVAKMVTNPPSVPCSVTDPAAGQCIRVQDFPFAFSASAIDPANSSLDVDGSIAAGGYLWDIRRTAEGSASMFTRTSPTLNYTFTQNGKYRVTLEVTDNDGAKTVTVVEVTVNKPPAAVIAPAQGCVFNLPPYTCEFDGSASADDDGQIVSYLWDFHDGTTSSEISPIKTWPNDLGYGSFPVTLTVVDNDGTSSVASVPVKVNRPPTASIGPSTLDVYRKKVFTFEGLASADLDGTVVSYEWDWGDGTAPQTTTSPTVGKAFQTKGTFTVELTVTDNDGGRGSVTRQVTVKNQPPVAWINTPTGPIVNEPAPFSIRLAGWPFSEDPDGTIVNYHWNFGDGTSTDAAADEVTHAYAAFGVYQVTLTVRDDDGVEVTSDPVSVKVNRRPTAAFTTSPADPYSLTVPFNVGFDATSSSDQDGTIQSYTWDFGDGTGPVLGATASHTYTVRGSYTVTLTVDDGEGGVATLTRTALVGINQLPTAKIVVSPTQLYSNDASATWTFDSTGSSDPDGTIASYGWDFGDGHAGTGSSVSHTFTTADCADNLPRSRCTVRLTVTDNRGSTATKTVIIKMNRPPTASITGAEPLRAGRGVPFKPNGGQSSDVDGSVSLYEWNWGDGSPVENTASSSPPHAYAANGDYVITLRVRDDNFLWSAPVQKTVRVENSPPTARIVPTPGFNGSNATTVVSNASPFALSLSGVTSSDPDGSIVSYAWDFGDGTTGAGPIVSHTFTTAGCAGNTPLPTACTVTLTVTDDSGLTHTTSIRVRMNQVPVAVITPVSGVPCGPYPPCTVTLTSADSYDPDPGGSLSANRIWGVNGSYAGNQITLTKTFSTPGTYSVTVAVVDNDNQQRTATYLIVVNNPPTAGFSTTPPNGVINTEPYSISFNGTGAGNSSDPDGSIVSYSWDFGDGSPLGTGSTTTHAYAVAGTYQVSLTVTDNRAATATITKPIKANAAPTAAIGPATLDPKLNLPFSFTGSGSTDSDGTVTSYAWDFGDGSTATGISPTHTYTSNGSQTVTLTVTDNNGRSTTTQRTLTVAPNVLPTAAFTMNPSGRIDDVPTQVAFDASASADPDGTIVSYAWDFGDGATGSGASPTHTYSTYGPRTITLTVTDNNGQTATTSQQLLVNQRPIAVIETSPNPPVLNSTPYTVDFFALRSEDLDGTIASYSWNFGDGSPDVTGDAASHTFADYGTYTVTLTVTDNNGATGTATIAVKVNRAPVPVMTYSPDDVRRQATVQFDGSGSSDPDGTVAVYQWDFGDGTGAGGASASHVYTTMGTFTATLTVSDENGRSATTTRAVAVGNANPVANIDTSPSPPKVDRGSNISFIGSGSFDPDGTIASYEWDYGDGATATGAAPPAHVYDAYGTYNVTLTITDNQGLTDQTSILVTISPPPDPSIGPTDGITRGIPFQFTSSGTSDPNGSIVSYYWDFGDGTTATGPSPVKTYSTSTGLGPFTVTLVVTDDAGRQVSVTRQITLLNQSPTASVSAIRLKQGVPSGAPAGPAPLDIQFFGSASGDPDGTIAEYRWDFGDGSPVATTASDSVTHTYTGSPRTVTATLTVVDNNGGTASRTVQITVSPNQSPVASFTISPPGPYAPNTPVTATADASASADPDGYIASYDWDFDGAGDFGGDTATGVTATHAYSSGYYTARLTVTDNSGATASTTRIVHIPGGLPAPSGLRQVSGGTFAWNPVPGAVAYKIMAIRTGGGVLCEWFGDPSNQVVTVDAPSIQTTLGGGGNCGPYDVSVQTRNLGASDWGPVSGTINVDW